VFLITIVFQDSPGLPPELLLFFPQFFGTIIIAETNDYKTNIKQLTIVQP